MFFANSLRDEPIKASDNDSSKMKDDKRHSALLLAERDEREGRLDEDVSETDVDWREGRPDRHANVVLEKYEVYGIYLLFTNVLRLTLICF